MSEQNHYQKKLEAEAKELITELNSLGVQNPGVPNDWIAIPDEPSDAEPDPIDLGDRSEEWQERRGTLDALETRFNNVKRALAKISEGNFGQCEICQTDIETDRLDANPAARTCKAHLEDEANLPLS